MALRKCVATPDGTAYVDMTAGEESARVAEEEAWALTLLPTVADYQKAIQTHVDATAKGRSYDSGVSLAGYASSTVPAWAAEAQTFINWRDAVWVYAYEELAKVQGGQRPQPSVAGLIAELPAIVWPA